MAWAVHSRAAAGVAIGLPPCVSSALTPSLCVRPSGCGHRLPAGPRLGIAHIVATSAATFACLPAWEKVALYTWRLLRVRRARRGADRTGFSSPDRCSGALGQSKSRKRLRNRSGAAAACRCALAVRGRRPDARRAPKTAPKTAPAPPRVDFCADVARLLPVEERVYAFDFWGGGRATIWAIPSHASGFRIDGKDRKDDETTKLEQPHTGGRVIDTQVSPRRMALQDIAH